MLRRGRAAAVHAARAFVLVLPRLPACALTCLLLFRDEVDAHAMGLKSLVARLAALWKHRSRCAPGRHRRALLGAHLAGSMPARPRSHTCLVLLTLGVTQQ